MSKKKIIWWGAFALAVVIGGVWYSTRTKETSYETERVGRSTVAQTVSVTGELRPVEYADLSFRQIGRIDSVLVREGDVVEMGQKIASIDMSVAVSQLRDAQLALSIAEENEKLSRRGWDNLKPEERVAKKLTTEQYREKIRTLRAQMKEGVLTAPLSGVITKLDARVGETVSIGKVVARVAKPDGMLLEARVPEADVAKIRVGMGADVTFDALSNDEIFPASVSEIRPSATVVSDVVSYETTFRLSSLDPRLLDGMSATIDIETVKAENVNVVPFRAIIREGSKAYVEIPKTDMTLEKREITLGIEGDEGMVEVASGLREGDEVVVTKKK